MAENEALATVEQDAPLDIADFESMGMSPTDMKDFFRWALGSESEPPEVVQKMMVNLSSKLSVGLGINIVGNIGRQTRLTKFLEKMEEELYDESRIEGMSEKEKMAAYKEARSTLNSIQEFQRKFIVQNKEFRPEGTEQEKLLGRIMALPKDKLAAIVAILDNDSAPAPTPPDDADQVFGDEPAAEL